MMEDNKKTLTTCNAIILAGGRRSNLNPEVCNKTFIEINGFPLFINVVNALLGVKRIQKIFIVGPIKEINSELTKRFSDLPAGKLLAVQEHSNIVENVWFPFLNSIESYVPGDEKNDFKIFNKSIFAVGGDTPLLTSMEVDEFLDNCVGIDSFDYFLGMTSSTNLVHYKPKGGKSGINMAYSHFAEGLLRINNMHLLFPFRIRKKEELFEFYKVRYLKSFVNILKSGIGIINRGIDFYGFAGWLQMILSMKLRKYGFAKLSDLIRKNVPVKRGEQVVGKLIGARCKIVLTTYGGSALDVDNKENIEAVKEMYEEWNAYQQSLNRP